jgi:phthiocerol/phenolphthiocerol synthesis type-I polyketide synthase E
MAGRPLSSRLRDLPPHQRALAERLLGTRTAPATAQSRPAPALSDAARQAFASSAARTKDGTREFYDAINDQIDATIFGSHAAFLNYGYEPDGTAEESVVEVEPHVLNRASVRLVLELIGAADLARANVLDVGCGRGGTLSVVDRYFGARRRTGLDLSASAIRFCRRAYHDRPILFLQGDAESLPFADGSQDVLVNLESSHSYPDAAGFYREVHRVLTRGGRFLYADVFPPEEFARRIAQLEGIGFGIERDRDITENVVRSCIQIGQRRAAVFDALGDPALVGDFVSAPGSTVFEAMRARRAVYRIVHLRRR